MATVPFLSTFSQSLRSVFAKVADALTYRDRTYSPYAHALYSNLQGFEYDPLLSGRRGVYTYDRMVREDGHVAGIVHQIKTPLRGVTWEVVADDPTVQLFVEDQLGVPEGRPGRIGFQRLLQDALTSLELGFSVFEVLYEQPRQDDADSDRWTQPLKAVEFRPQASIHAFETEGQTLAGIEQIDLDQPSQTVRLGGDRLLYFAPHLQGTDWWGRSILRPCYKHWYHKECLYLIQAIASERFGVPIPHMQYDRGTPVDQVDAMKRVLKALHSDTQTALVTQHNRWRLRFEAPERGTMPDLMPQVRHHDEKISAAVLALFMELGTSQTGSRAVSHDFVDLFFGSLRAYANYLRDRLNEQLVTPLVAMNFGPEARAQLEWSNLSLHSIEEWVQSVVALAERGLIQWGTQDELTARHVVNIKNNPPAEGEHLPLTPVPTAHADADAE